MFLLLIPLALALLVGSALGLAGVGPLTDERRADRNGIAGGIGPALGLLFGATLLVVAVLGSIGLAGLSGGDAGREPSVGSSPLPTASTAPTTREQTTPAASVITTTTSTLVTSPGAPVPGRRVTVEAEVDEGATFPASYEVADGLAPDTVLSMRVLGFPSFGSATAEQCVPGVSPRCGNRIPVQFDEHGAAHFQYLISDDFSTAGPATEGCRADAPPCTIEIRSYDRETERETRASIQTVFGDELPPPGRIEVAPSTGLSLNGEPVTVEVRDYPPGAEVAAMLCAAPDAYGARCGAPGPIATVVVGGDGTGRATLFVTPGPVGTERAPCSRGDDCGVSVASDDVFARAPVVPITFAAPPGAVYDPLRLALGLALAVLLLAAAAVLLVRTDWDPVGEAAAPEIDDAEYADLDAIIAALPPEDDDELMAVP